MGNVLVRLAGARPEVLARCETERTKFQSIGWAILITSGMAAVSMWFALTSAMGYNWLLSVPVALLWGLVIMGIDRWLVTSIRPGGTRRWAIAVPRVVLAILLGTLISTPFVLRIFQSEINNQVALIKEQRYGSFLDQQKNSLVSRQVAQYSAEVGNLQQVINSGGQTPLNPSADKVVQSLTSQFNTDVKLENQYYRQWQCQLYGGPGCPAGNGQLAQASQQSYEQAKHQAAVLTSEISQREQVLQQTDASHASVRYQEAVSALPQAKQELANATAQRDALRNTYQSTNLAANGLLIRLQALNQLTAGNSTLDAARILLFLLFLVIECLPVAVKLMVPPGNYESILALIADQELKDARRSIRGHAVLPVDSAPRFSDGAAAGSASPGHPSTQDVIRDVWRSPRKVPAEDARTQPIDTLSAGAAGEAEPAERNRLDETLRTLRDIPSDTVSDSLAGAELRYGADEL
jgi:hypothetical protein